MAFTIVAEFPLGTYRGRQPDGRLDPLPSPARLHAAFLNAAGQGSRAVVAGDLLMPSDADRRALEWMELHPPERLTIPDSIATSDAVIAYRDEGFFGSRPGRTVLESRADLLGSVAVRGAMAWTWDADPPGDVASAIGSLCRDVSHLGSAETPVLLQIGEAAPTHRLDRDADTFHGRGIEMDLPAPGRTAALVAAHDRLVSPKPRPRDDRRTGNESASSAPVERAGLQRGRYVSVAAQTSASPWPTVVALRVDREIAPRDRVRWCVAVHRALVSLISEDPPALVTGHYPEGAARPANRLAIQFLPASTPGSPMTAGSGAFLLLIPADAPPENLAVLARAVSKLGAIRSGRFRVVVQEHQTLSGATFWNPVAAGFRRLWVTDTPAVPESRPVRGRSWTIGDAALVSLGMVYRDDFPRLRRRSEWLPALAEGVSGRGAAVLDAHKVFSGTREEYVHHIAPESAVQPYVAVIQLGNLATDQTLIAIGQSRHLGGGLLRPLDLPLRWFDGQDMTEGAE